MAPLTVQAERSCLPSIFQRAQQRLLGLFQLPIGRLQKPDDAGKTVEVDKLWAFQAKKKTLILIIIAAVAQFHHFIVSLFPSSFIFL